MMITANDRTVPITVFARSPASPGTSFRIIAPIDLSKVFLADALFPGIAGVEEQKDSWDHTGVSRRPRFTDGTQVTETLTEYVDGHGFAYELTGFTNALASLALGVRGEFSFLPDGEGSMIRWTYEFKPKRGRRWIIAGPFRPLWQRYMQKALERMVSVIVEQRLAGPVVQPS
jgi:hypothetical protein